MDYNRNHKMLSENPSLVILNYIAPYILILISKVHILDISTSSTFILIKFPSHFVLTSKCRNGDRVLVKLYLKDWEFKGSVLLG